jgi:hypothetical protein
LDNIELKKGYAKVTVPDIEDDVSLYGAQFNPSFPSLRPPALAWALVPIRDKCDISHLRTLTTVVETGSLGPENGVQIKIKRGAIKFGQGYTYDTLPGLPSRCRPGTQHHWAGLKVMVMARSLLSSNPFYVPFFSPFVLDLSL